MHESFERITSQHAHCQFLQWLGTATDSKALLLIKIALLGICCTTYIVPLGRDLFLHINTIVYSS